jgi:prevent-host-death family protein
MMTIGIRELRQHASRFLRLVEQGETVQVTDRGRPVALIVPVPSTGPIEALEVAGRLERGRGDLLDLGDPLPPAEGVALPSAVLARARDDER